MTTQDSDSALAGKVAAALTPAAPRMHVPRGTQSSGFFDLDTLFSMHVQQVRRPTRMPPPLPTSLPPTSLPARRAPPAAELLRAPRATPVPLDVPGARAMAITWHTVNTRRTPRPRPIGWFAVFVTWLATATLATLTATQLPGHVPTRSRGTVAQVAPVAAPDAVPVPVAAPAPVPASASAPAQVSAPASVAIADLPHATSPASTAPTRNVATHASATPRPVQVATTPRPAPAPAAAPAPAPVSTANMSLEDLIKHEVATEQKRLHPSASR